MRFTATWWFFASKGSKNASESDVVVIRNSKIEHVLPYKSLTKQDIALRFGQVVLWTISIRCGFLLHDGFLALRSRKMRPKVSTFWSRAKNVFTKSFKSPTKLVFNDSECESFIKWGSILSNFLSFVRMLSSSEGKSFFKWRSISV